MSEAARGCLHRLGAWLVFPVVLGGALWLSILWLERGASPALVVAVTLFFTPIAVAVLEHVLPFRRDWNRSHGDLSTDVAHALVSGIATQQLLKPILAAGGVAVAGALSRMFGASLWPDSWPLIAQLALALVIAEFAQYWLHRWQHEKDWLWRFHAVHHSAPRLYWLNAARFHPGDLGLLFAVGYAPLVALGCNEQTLALFAMFDALFGMLQHCNVDVRLGPLNRIFSMAEPHRWHHSRVLEEANTNYGSNLMIWDLVFGTFFLPADRAAPGNIGIAGMPDFPPGYLAQLAVPFRWHRVKAESLRDAA